MKKVFAIALSLIMVLSLLAGLLATRVKEESDS